MNKNIIIAVAIALLVGGGIGYQIAPKREMSTPATPTEIMSGNNGMENTMTSMTANIKDKKGDALDSAFLDGMIVHHEGAIEMAKIALAGSKRPEIKKMAEDIISAQSSEITTMKGWLNQWFGR
jgi:uncharacterized protein (DUF305 family)